jgi:hypothetical protein
VAKYAKRSLEISFGKTLKTEKGPQKRFTAENAEYAEKS